MAPTVEYLEERFDTFNRMCFDGALPRIPIKLSNARGFVGRLQYRPVRDWRGRVVRHEDFVLRISRHFDLTEAEVNRFPRCRTAKLFPVEPEELRKHMNEELFVSCSP